MYEWRSLNLNVILIILNNYIPNETKACNIYFIYSFFSYSRINVKKFLNIQIKLNPGGLNEQETELDYCSIFAVSALLNSVYLPNDS